MTTLSQQCRFFAGKHVDVHDGRCFLPGSLPQLAKVIYEGTLFFFFNQQALPGGVVRVSDWFPKVGGSNPSLGHVHDGRCFLPGSPTH
jgi:hypothetical protein